MLSFLLLACEWCTSLCVVSELFLIMVVGSTFREPISEEALDTFSLKAHGGCGWLCWRTDRPAATLARSFVRLHLLDTALHAICMARSLGAVDTLSQEHSLPIMICYLLHA
mmetsp:Transcript_36222/g.88132  ORF Transcript_36222/g.88132 Transcript_36222/m.88132 type:complete len:111 (-) Transcript_36222:217-549(-)